MYNKLNGEEYLDMHAAVSMSLRFQTGFGII